jgi:hypothetical protein
MFTSVIATLTKAPGKLDTSLFLRKALVAALLYVL